MTNVEKSTNAEAKSDKGTVLLSPKNTTNVEKSTNTEEKSDKRTVPLSHRNNEK